MAEMDKKNLNARQIIKYANSKKLMDAVDEIDTIYNGDGNKAGTFNKKIVLTVNEFGMQGHKEKQASFYWDLHDALLVCDDIVSGRFEKECYGLFQDRERKQPIFGSYSSYGGGKYSRILQIGVKDGNYIIQVSLYGAIRGKNGSVMPDKNNKIDAHNIQLSRYEARKFFKAIQSTIESKIGKMTSVIPTDRTPVKQEQPKQQPKQEVKSNDLINPFEVDLDSDPFAS